MNDDTDTYYIDKYGKLKEVRITIIPFKEWSRWAKIVEKLYRLTHDGQIRTLVVKR